jgi:hypothetical protein
MATSSSGNKGTYAKRKHNSEGLRSGSSSLQASPRSGRVNAKGAPSLRTNPPSIEANNTDVFMWALYVLGGAEKQVDVEAIYLKVFELAPARMGWRTRPDLPNFKKTAKALQEIEAKSHIGLLMKMGSNFRRLTPTGVEWVEKYREILSKTYQGQAPVPAPKNADNSRRLREIKTSQVWEVWVNGAELTLDYLAFALKCSKGSPESIWLDRLADLDRMASSNDDPQFRKFAIEAREVFKKGTK